MHTAFISYSPEDKAVAFGACKALEAGGVTCWIAPRDVMTERPDRGQISEAIRRARAFVLVLSRKSDRSRQVLWEVERAAHSRLRLIAFQIEDFEHGDDLGYFLSVERRLDAFEGSSPETHFPELLQHTKALVKEDVYEALGEESKPGPAAEPVGTEKFANYYILKRPDGTLFRLGPGAMGITYKAFDTSLDRHVALKVIAADLLGNDEARRRFLREARAAAKIQHPHVAAIYHLGREGDVYFYTMELVDGEDMELYVKARGPLSPAAALRVILQVAEALEAAQVHKLIHRDIKPANIMARINRARNLDVKLIDFGLAKGTGPGSQDLSRVTHTVSFVGSPAYASPEQCEMGELDTRSDIYSLGATLWYLLTGKPPFAGNVNQVLIAHATKLPPFGQLQGIPESVVGLLRQMLAKTPDDRPKDPKALQETIQAIGPQLAGDLWRTSERASGETSSVPVEISGNFENQGSSDVPETLASPLLDVYQRVEPGVLIAERYRLIEEQTEGNGGRLFLAHDEEVGSAHAVQVALKLVHPEIATQFLDLLKDEINVIKGASYPNLVVYSGLESAASGVFIVREWVHGFLLYDLLRLRRSLKPEEVMAVLESLPVTLDLISERGLGLVDVSIRKLFVSCPVDVRPDEFINLAKGDAGAWAKCTLKLNPLSLGPLLFCRRRDWSSQTLVPSSRVLSMTQAEAGIRGTKAVRLLGRLIYELIRGQALSLQANERPSPLPLLNEAGNQALFKAWVPGGEATPYRNCEEFWGRFKESVSDRIRPAAPPPAKKEADKPPVETSKGGYSLPLEPVASAREMPPKSSVGRTVGKRPSRPIITFLAIAAVLMVGGLIYIAIRPSQLSPAQHAPVAAVTPRSLVIAAPTLEEEASPIPELAVQPSAQPAAPVAVVTPNSSISASTGEEELANKTLDKATKDHPWVNSLGMKFVPVAGTQVLFSVWDTRVRDFETFVESTGYDVTGGMYSLGKDGWKQRGATWKAPGFSQETSHPVVGVSWNDAEKFCEWLTKRERSAGDLPKDGEYRLPKDEEWSAAVGLKNEVWNTPEEKSGKIKLYPWDITQKLDKSWPPSSGAGNYCGLESRIGNEPKNWPVIDGYNDGYPRTSPVGSFEGNEMGLYDMGGNVWQWCEDWYNSQNRNRVLRGASWVNNGPEFLLASYRYGGFTSTYCSAVIGFRCVVAVEFLR